VPLTQTTYAKGTDIRLGVVRGISYGMYDVPERFVPQVRRLGAGLLRVYVYWSQIEPRPNVFNFDVVDALLDQLDGTEEVWLTVCSSSTWATRQPTTLLPPSPAKDQSRYRGFLRRLVRHCAGRVHYWQCNNEPTDSAMLWAGTAEEYVRQLAVLHEVVKEIDPDASVILGGAPFLLPMVPPDSHERQFFDVLLRTGGDHFDLFDLHLYGPATAIPEHVDMVRGLMREHGYEKPVVVGEYNGPWPVLFQDAMTILGPTNAAREGSRAAEHAAMAGLYDRMVTLPPTLRMFMTGCEPELDEKRYRIACREIVMRNLLAFSTGVRRTVLWNLAPESPGFANPLSMMDIMFRTFALMDFAGGELSVRHPSADAFELVARQLAGADRIRRVDVPERADQYLFEVRRPGREPSLATWLDRDTFSGEDEPDVELDLPWTGTAAHAVDALGRTPATVMRDGRVRVPVGVTPVFVSEPEGT
jgi:hypothetical protein